MIVDIEELNRLHARLKEINDAPLASIEWRHKGKTVDIAFEDIDFWRFTGLSNEHFFEYLEIS